MSNKPTQRERIIKYISDFGSITPFQAYEDLGITKLATRVSELKREGYEFKQVYLCKHNRYGEKVRFMQYSFRK